MVECFLDMVRRDPTKERLQLGKIRVAGRRSTRLFCSSDLMFMDVVERLDVRKCSGRELMDMSDTMINQIFKFVIRRMHDGLGELRSDSSFIITIFVEELVVGMQFMFFQSIMPVVISIFNLKIKNGGIPRRILSEYDMRKRIKFVSCGRTNR